MNTLALILTLSFAQAPRASALAALEHLPTPLQIYQALPDESLARRNRASLWKVAKELLARVGPNLRAFSERPLEEQRAAVLAYIEQRGAARADLGAIELIPFARGDAGGLYYYNSMRACLMRDSKRREFLLPSHPFSSPIPAGAPWSLSAREDVERASLLAKDYYYCLPPNYWSGAVPPQTCLLRMTPPSLLSPDNTFPDGGREWRETMEGLNNDLHVFLSFSRTERREVMQRYARACLSILDVGPGQGLQYDCGKLDLVALATGRGLLLYPDKELAFLAAKRGGALELSPGWRSFRASSRPRQIADPAAIAKAARAVEQGYFDRRTGAATEPTLGQGGRSGSGQEGALEADSREGDGDASELGSSRRSKPWPFGRCERPSCQ